MTDIFISYSRTDSMFVRRLHDALAASERDVWVDWEDIPLSADWWREIREGIEAADTFVFVITKASVESIICNFEVVHAVTNGKRIIPILREEVDNDASRNVLLAKPLDNSARAILANRDMSDVQRTAWNALARHNWLFFKDSADFDTIFQKLLKSIETDLTHTKEHTRILVRTLEWDNNNRDNSFLLSGTDLISAEQWLSTAQQKEPTPTALQSKYIMVSRTVERQRSRRLLAGVSVALVVSILLAIAALIGFRDADIARDAAQQAQATSYRQAQEGNAFANALQLDNLLNTVPELAYAIVLELFTLPNLPIQIEQQIRDVVNDSAIVRQTALEQTINDFEVSADGSVAIGHNETNIYVYNTNDWSIQHTFSPYSDTTVELIAIHPDGSTVYAASNAFSTTAEFIAWDVVTGAILWQQTYPSGVQDVAFSPDGSLFLITYVSSETIANQIERRDAKTGDWLGEYDLPAEDGFSLSNGDTINKFADNTDWTNPLIYLTLAVNSDGSLIAVGGDILLVIDTNSGEWLAAGTESNGNLLLREIAFISPSDASELRYSESEYIVGLSVPGLESFVTDLTLTEVQFDDPLRMSIVRTEPQFVCSLDYVADQDEIIITSCDAIERRNYRGEILKSIPNSTFIWDTAYAADTKIFYTLDDSSVIKEWDMHYNRSVVSALNDGEVTMGTVNATIQWLEGQPTTFVTNARDSLMAYWDYESKIIIPIDKATFESSVVSPSGQYMAMRSAGNEIQITDLTSDETKNIPLDDYTYIADLQYHPTESVVVVIATDNTNYAIITTDINDDWVRTLYTAEQEITVARYSPDGSRIGIILANGEVLILDSATGDVSLTYRAHTGKVNDLAISPDNSFIITVGDDSNVVIWDAVQNRLIERINRHNTPVSGVTINHDGTQMATIDLSNTVYLWSLPDGQLLQEMVSPYLPNDNIFTRPALSFSPDGQFLAVVTPYTDVIVFRIESRESLIAWMLDNRFIGQITCADRDQFNLLPQCVEGTPQPTITPYPN